MLSLSASLKPSQVACDDPLDACNLYTNADAVGNASGELNSAPENPSPIRLFPGVDEGYAGDLTDRLAVAVPVGPFCFGRLKIGFKAIDSLGNEQDGAIAEDEMTINSPPTPVTSFRRGDWDEENAQQAFTFTESPQLVQ